MKALGQVVNFIRNMLIIKFSRKIHVPDKAAMLQEWYQPATPLTRSTEPVITWIGQATFLVQIDGINIITDPIFFDLSYFIPRLAPAGIHPKQLPPIDYLLISHDHRDHMEKKSLLELVPHNPTVLVPHGLGKRLARRGFTKIVEHRWGDRHVIPTLSGKKLTTTFLPANHWAGSSLFNMNKSGYGSWMIEHDNHTAYFGGDTSYGNHFKEIGEQFPEITTAMLPIGPIEPRHLVEHAHLDGRQAIQAFLDLGAKQFIPMHWGTFQFGIEQYDEPVHLLKAWWHKNKNALSEKELLILKLGKGQKVAVGLPKFFAVNKSVEQRSNRAAQQ